MAIYDSGFVYICMVLKFMTPSYSAKYKSLASLQNHNSSLILQIYVRAEIPNKMSFQLLEKKLEIKGYLFRHFHDLSKFHFE